MIQQVIAFSIRQRAVVLLLTAALIISGIWSMLKVPIDAVPDITNNQVQIITQAPNLGTEAIEQFVTYPVELGMANLPGVLEIRSVSRFGLSVVTVVFEDSMGSYLPRQLVSEKLVAIRGEIPAGFGKPEMGPISTGLGEVLQYTIAVDSTYRKDYSLADLRTIQDWIIRRQMAMVPGVVEVNAFGGEVKQYEVAVAPNRLNAIGLTMGDVLEALTTNNINTGGAYIQKNHQAQFIRGEGLIADSADLAMVLVANFGGVPITIGDVAQVKLGKAVRYGALTKDGNGEAVGGMILMLKGANSNDVINAVNKRLSSIQASLPPGVRIEPFLDRSDLIESTTATVRNNLIEGALIVIFVLVVLLGNWRGGLIVASTIPLALLFAFTLMNAFGVWANLMSLGAIDFGIIVDGAVIIVEGTVFAFQRKRADGVALSREARERETSWAAGSMMQSAFFGQLIILVVFVPLLALEGIEGKMFQPMALTFMFAMLGAMLLCLTYVPMMSAWVIRIPDQESQSWGGRIVAMLERAYERALIPALKMPKLVLGVALCLLTLAVGLYSTLGGEFIPQLDEGDVAFHTILRPGSSLDETIKATTEAERIVLMNFSEVEHVMSRIGVAEVPTDPMPMDVADCIVTLKPQSEWDSGRSKAELVAAMKKAVAVIPGVNFEFTQPIEMRFNELLTGVREDVAIKLFGDDLETLAEKAAEIGDLIKGIPGVGDWRVEATDGLPQITIQHNRKKLAQYGVSVQAVNDLIEMAFAGKSAGIIFEGEKRFELVVRLKEELRSSLTDVESLLVPIAGGNQVPLGELATVSYVPGPMQISRDNTNRRTYVGINVRGRDVKSMVTEIQEVLDEKLTLPPGYFIRYGGAFENLERATAKLQVVVPISLVLIFILIYLALGSFKQAVMIYLAIPMAAIGGVFSLWLRDMPFSISAGVGFIVLFGVAVLNGLVLISSWNELKDEDGTLTERILKGGKRRIRPILLTALTDIFGFLPMAMSTSSGAEVQQPLATVVIGGMVTATCLTLFVLPILYHWITQRSQPVKPVVLTVSVLFIVGIACGQSTVNSAEEAIQMAQSNNRMLKRSALHKDLASAEKIRAFSIPKTALAIQLGAYNSAEEDFLWSVNQRLDFPTLYLKKRQWAKALVEEREWSYKVSANELAFMVRTAWNNLASAEAKYDLMLKRDSLYKAVLSSYEEMEQAGHSTKLELTAASLQAMKAKQAARKAESARVIAESQLRALLQDTSEVVQFNTSFEPLLLAEEPRLENNPILGMHAQQVQVAERKTQVATQQWLPGISLGYTNLSMVGIPVDNGSIAQRSDRFSFLSAGVSIPLFFGNQRAASKTAQVERELAINRAEEHALKLRETLIQEQASYRQNQAAVADYQRVALNQAALLEEQAQLSWEAGSINVVTYFQLLNESLSVRMAYLDAVKAVNTSYYSLLLISGNSL